MYICCTNNPQTVSCATPPHTIQIIPVGLLRGSSPTPPRPSIHPSIHRNKKMKTHRNLNRGQHVPPFTQRGDSVRPGSSHAANGVSPGYSAPRHPATQSPHSPRRPSCSSCPPRQQGGRSTPYAAPSSPRPDLPSCCCGASPPPPPLLCHCRVRGGCWTGLLIILVHWTVWKRRTSSRTRLSRHRRSRRCRLPRGGIPRRCRRGCG